MNRFTPLLERLRALSFPEADEGDDVAEVSPPATPEELAQLESVFGGTLPAELREFAQASLGFSAAPSPALDHVGLDLRPSEVTDWSNRGFEGLFRVGGQDDTTPLLLEPTGDSARLWAFTEDPLGLMLIAPTLTDYVERCVAFCEGVAAAEDEGDFEVGPPTDDPGTVRPVKRRALVGQGGAVGQFVEGLPKGALVFDLREVDCPAELALPEDLDWRLVPGAFRREGLVVAVVPGLAAPRPDADPAEPILARVFSFFSMELYEQAQRELDAGLAALPDHERLLAWVKPLADKRRG